MVVGLGGLEPPTSRLSGVRSNHLSYRPKYGGNNRARTYDPLLVRQMLSQLSYAPTLNLANLAGMAGFEPTTFGFGDRRSTTELHPYL